MSLLTARLGLHAVDEDEARRICGRAPADGDRWASDYPFDGDIAGLGAFLRAVERHGPQQPFGYYQLIRRSDGLAIGGIGFKGPPRDGAVEIGYGLVPSARGAGYATESVRAMVELAARLGVTTVRADTDTDNVASQRVLEKAGFRPTGVTADARFFEIAARTDSPT